MTDFNLFRFQNQLNTKPLEEGLARDYENAGRSISGLIRLGLKKKGVEFVSCPTCGRTQINLIKIAEEVENRLENYKKDVKVAVMGCVVNGPVYDLATTLEKLLSVGFSLEEVIEKVTINPAKIFHFETKGELKPGMDADITIFTLNEEAKEVVDSNDNHVTVNHTIHPTMCLVAGNSYKIGE